VYICYVVRRELRERLARFRAVYYRLRILRGLLILLLWGGGVFFLSSLTEGLFWWGVPVRLILWISWVGGLLYFLAREVLWPILQYGFQLRGYLSDEEAARWIGRHFPEIQDKLLNALQLEHQHPELNAAVALALEERQAVVLRYPWEVSLPKKPIRRYALLLLGLILLGGVSWLSMPQVVGGGAERFLQPTKAFLPPLPYHIEVEGLRPFYRKGEELTLTFLVRGHSLPQTLSAYQEGGLPLPLERETPQRYVLSLPHLERSFTLWLSDGAREVGRYSILVQEPPSIERLQLIATYPAYTGLKADTLSQTRARVLKGTHLALQLQIRGEIPYRLHAPTLPLLPRAPGWEATWIASQDAEYPLVIESTLGKDTFRLFVEVYPDNYPIVQLFSEDFDPETYVQRVRLRLMDDFGFTKAVLWYRIVESSVPGRSEEAFRMRPLAVSSSPQQDLSLALPWKEWGIQTGEAVEYYVEVWDNDAITGPKASRSILYTLRPASDAEKQAVFAQLQDSLFQQLKFLRQELDHLLQTREAFTSPQKASQLSERFRALRSEMRTLERLAVEENLFTPELLEHLEALQKILEAADPQKVEQLLAQPPPSQDSMEQARRQAELEKAYEAWREKLERWEALLPAYQEARKLEELMTRLDALQERQQALSEVPDSLRSDAHKAQQQRLQEETQAVAKQVDSLIRNSPQMNETLKDSLRKAAEYLREAMRNMNEALQKMEQGTSPQKDQQEAAKDLEKATEAINQGQQQAEAQEEAEDYEALRQLLKGILQLSFRQEAVQKESREAERSSKSYVALQRKQSEISQDYRPMRDTLRALSERSPVIAEEILDLLRDMDEHFRGLSFQDFTRLGLRQQYILQGLNRLANLMTELLASLEERQQNRQQGGGACKRSFKIRRKGGQSQSGQNQQSRAGERSAPRPSSRKNTSGTSPIPQLKQLQQSLNEALEKLSQPNPAAESPGGELSPQERARLSAQQELIRLRLQEWLRQNPSDQGQLQDLIQQMQEAEKDLLTQRITRERLLRQQAILTRLLEYEKSQRERELSPERESRTAQQFFQRTVGTYPVYSPQPATLPAKAPLWFFEPPYQTLIQSFTQP